MTAGTTFNPCLQAGFVFHLPPLVAFLPEKYYYCLVSNNQLGFSRITHNQL